MPLSKTLMKYKEKLDQAARQNVLEVGCSYLLLTWCDCYATTSVLEPCLKQGLEKNDVATVLSIKTTFFYTYAEIFCDGRRVYILCNQAVDAGREPRNIWKKIC